MASSLSQQHSTVGDDAVDAMDKFINESGCADMHYKLQECYAETKDWRKCQQEVKDFRNCMYPTNKENKSSKRT